MIVSLGGLFYIGGQYVASQPQRVEQEAEANREITVQGTGEVTAVPDIGKITLGVKTGTLSSAEMAMSQLTEKFNAVLAAVEDYGVNEEDIKATNLSVNPVYDYNDGRQTLRGYEATESIEVKVLETDKMGGILAVATGEGVNQAGNVSFEIDDPAKLQLEAKKKAIDDAREDAEELADALGVRLGRVKSFSVSEGNAPQPFYDLKTMAAPEGRGGGVEIPSGSQDVSATVSVTYELK
jgi:uncharacterized protein YggE